MDDADCGEGALTMAIKRTRWFPDTCSCQIDYEWDDALPPDARIHKPVSAIACGRHSADPHAMVTAENTNKNRAIAAAVQALDLAPGDVSFSFDAARTLRLHLPPAHRDKRGLAQQAVDAVVPGVMILSD